MNAPSPATPNPPWHQRRFARYALAGLALTALAGAGYWGWQKVNAGRNSREQYQIATVQRGDIQDLVTATGTVQPRDYVDVGAQVSGQLKKLHVEVGTVVQSGDLLAEIDPTVLLATLDARRAGLRNQQATLTERESTLALALLQATRQKNLMAADATTAEALQEADAAVRAARAQIEAVKAQIAQTQSQMRGDEANLNYTKIFAPMGGTVVSVTARQGQTLNANQSAPIILRVADLSTMTVQTQVSEAEVNKLRMGMEVYFTTLGGQGRRWYGELRKVEPTPTVTNNVVLYNALFDVANTNQALLPSMTTQVFFVAASAKDVMLVPTAAVTLQRANAGGGTGAGGNATGGRRERAASEPASGGRAVAASQAASSPLRAASTPPADASASRFAAMSPEERRAAFEKMTPAERQAARDRRRGGRGEQGTASAPAAASAPGTTASGPLPRPSSTGGFSTGTSATRAPRKATVKVIDAEGRIEERQIEVGVTTRVQVQVLSGLTEGEQVIAGLKPPPAAQRAQAAGNPPGLPGAPPPGARGR
jgi:macrolide-specific efflux system membrane fusion protein